MVTDLAVIVPCYNEALSITDTLMQLKLAITKLNQIHGPLDIGIWVYDNNSTDDTVETKILIFQLYSVLNRVKGMLSDRPLHRLMQEFTA